MANPLIYDQKYWDDLVKDRKSGERETRRTEREIEIERKLKTPVLPKYDETPLSEVVEGLSRAGRREHPSRSARPEPGRRRIEHADHAQPAQEISLKSALNLILEPLHLSYIVKDEVLKITSEQIRDGEIYSKVYNVGDLVIPIPNFVPNNNIGLQGLINDAYAVDGLRQRRPGRARTDGAGERPARTAAGPMPTTTCWPSNLAAAAMGAPAAARTRADRQRSRRAGRCAPTPTSIR